MIVDQRDDVVFTKRQAEALRLVHNRRFDAVVIDSENESSELLDFTLELYQTKPGLPVFLTNDWGTELPMGLNGLASGAFAW